MGADLLVRYYCFFLGIEMPFRPPTWLESFDPYNEYLRAGAAGTLRLPEYRRVSEVFLALRKRLGY